MRWRPNHTLREARIVTTQDFITELFCRGDDQMKELPKHSQAALHPSEIVTLAFILAIKGGGSRPCYRWLTRDFQALVPSLPERTRREFPARAAPFVLYSHCPVTRFMRCLLLASEA